MAMRPSTSADAGRSSSINRIINNFPNRILNFPAELIQALYKVYMQAVAEMITDANNQSRYFRRLAMEIAFQDDLRHRGYEEEDDRRYGPGF